jgi:hypothetical protein
VTPNALIRSATRFQSTIKMISEDTAHGTIIGYSQASGPPLEVKLIFVFTGLFQFTGPDRTVADYTQAVYLPPEGMWDGLPQGNPLIKPTLAPQLTFKRVPLIPYAM